MMLPPPRYPPSPHYVPPHSRPTTATTIGGFIIVGLAALAFVVAMGNFIVYALTFGKPAFADYDGPGAALLLSVQFIGCFGLIVSISLSFFLAKVTASPQAPRHRDPSEDPAARPPARKGVRIIGFALGILSGALCVAALNAAWVLTSRGTVSLALVWLGGTAIVGLVALVISVVAQRRAPFGLAYIGLLIALVASILSTCSALTVWQVGPGYAQALANGTYARPISFADISPAQVDVSASKVDNDIIAVSIISVSFMLNGAPVRFDGADAVKCNGVALHITYRDTEYLGSIDPAATYDCLVHDAGQAVHFTVPATMAPTIQSPRPGAQVPHTGPLAITFATDPAGPQTIKGQLFVKPPGEFERSFDLLDIPDTGTYLLDLTPYTVGEAQLELTRSDSQDLMGSTFHSVHAVATHIVRSARFTLI